MKLLKDIDISGKNVLLRLDLDVPMTDGKIGDDTRLVDELPTLTYLLERGARVMVIGHLGRPRPRNNEQKTMNNEFVEGPDSLRPICEWFRKRLEKHNNQLRFLENLRINQGEEANEASFADDIVRRSQAQLYVFDAFAASHRRHASVVQMPKLLPTACGFRMVDELSHLQMILENPKRPLVLVLGGAKPETKLPFVAGFASLADEILLGGLLPKKINDYPKTNGKAKLTVAELTADGLDITPESATKFAQTILSAGTVVWNGPMGLFESPLNALTHQRINASDVLGTSAYGTYVVAKAVNETGAYTVIGGGDTEAATTVFNLQSGIDWISSGGGAMLHLLAYRTLPFLEAITS